MVAGDKPRSSRWYAAKSASRSANGTVLGWGSSKHPKKCSHVVAVWTKSFRDHWRACTRWRWCRSRVPISVCKWYGLGLGFFQTSQEVQPCRGRLDKEFPRPLEGLHTMAMVPLTSPAIRRRLDGWRVDRLAAGDVDPLGDHQKFASVA